MMEQNPFNPSFGNRPSRIVGRSSQVQSILQGLGGRQGSRERCVLMLGQRGMGKTSMLLELADHAEELGYVAARASAGPSMIEDLIDAVQFEGSKVLQRESMHVSGVSAGALGFSVGLSFTQEAEVNYGFRAKMALLCDRLAEVGRGVLLVVDEVQPNSDQMRQFAGAYQLLVGDGKNVAIAMAGLPSSISNVLNDEVLTFLNRASKEQLGSLPIAQIREYYITTFDGLGMDVPIELSARAAEATRGFPYLLQLVGYYLVEYASASSVSERTLELAIEAAREDLVRNVFEPTLRPLSNGDLAFLHAMAPDGGVSSTADIAERLGGDKNRVQPYRARLIDAGVVAAPRRGELEFTLPYLAEYLAGTFE